MDTPQYGFLPYVPSTLTEYALWALDILSHTDRLHKLSAPTGCTNLIPT